MKKTKPKKIQKVKTGVVVKDKMAKSISVECEVTVKHPVFYKYIRKQTVYKVHDETNKAKTGDLVKITETRPISKTKRWRLVEVIKKGRKGGSS